MGMYDTIKIKKQLPLPEEVKNLNINWLDIEYQTKDLDNCLSEYILSKDGKLIEVIIKREYIPWTEEERKAQKISPWSLFKDVKELSRTEKEINYHGVIRFYCYERFDEMHDFHIDYDAYFIYGKLDKLEIAEFKKFSVNRNTLQELFEERKKLKYRIKRALAIYSGWNWFWKSLTKVLFNITSFIEKLRIFIFKYFI
jgi:hypothetical protein